MVKLEAARCRLAGTTTAAILAGINLTPKNVDETLTVLETVTARLHASEGVLAAFPDVYSIITQKVAEQVQRLDGIFLEPRWISRLAGRFCERYLETLCAWLEHRPQDCEAWAATYACSALPIAVPAQHVLLGLSAHVNFDLALGTYQTILEFGHASNPEMLARYKLDFEQINILLMASLPEALERLSTRHGCLVSATLSVRAYVVTRWLTMQLLTRWRAVVWTNICALLKARTAAARRALIAKIARRAGLYGRLLKLPSEIASAPFASSNAPCQPLAKVIPLAERARLGPRPQTAESPTYPQVNELLCA